MQTVYEIRNNGVRWQTTDADTAEEYSKQGARVTSHVVEVVQQHPQDKGALILSDTEDWPQSQKRIIADRDSWIDMDSLR